MRQLVLATGLLLGTASLAGATGEFQCDIADENLTLSFSGGLSDGAGDQILGYQAQAEIKAKVVSEAIRKPDLSAALVHHWIRQPELKFHFYTETFSGADQFIFELLLTTEFVEKKNSYEGEYQLRVFSGDLDQDIEVTGKATCFR